MIIPRYSCNCAFVDNDSCNICDSNAIISVINNDKLGTMILPVEREMVEIMDVNADDNLL